MRTRARIPARCAPKRLKLLPVKSNGRPTDPRTQTGSVLVEIEEPAATPPNGTGSSIPTQAFLSSADKAGVPELSIPRSPCPAAEAAAVVSVPAPAETGTARQGGAGLNGESDAYGVGGGGSARRQVRARTIRKGTSWYEINLLGDVFAGAGGVDPCGGVDACN